MKYNFIGLDISTVLFLNGKVHLFVLGSIKMKDYTFFLQFKDTKKNIDWNIIDNDIFYIDVVLDYWNDEFKLMLNDKNNKEYIISDFKYNFLNVINNTRKYKKIVNGVVSGSELIVDNDIIGINKNTLYGIFNPVFVVGGTLLEKNSSFELVVDDRKQEFDINNKDNDFLIQKKLGFFDKDIKLYIILDDKKYFVCSNKNYLFKRLYLRLTSFFRSSYLSSIFKTLINGIVYLWNEYHFLVPPKLWKKYFIEFKDSVRRKEGISLYYNPFDVKDYNIWLSKNKNKNNYKVFDYNPLISLLIPVYNVKSELLDECINSILNQSYKNFEICLVDDYSTNKDTINGLKKYENNPLIKIKYRDKNGHISVATNDALKMANGEYIGLIDNDDVIDKDALYEVVNLINNKRDADFIYSDEDKIGLDGRYCDPHFKPDYSPDTLMSLNYICHFSVIRKNIIDKVGGFRVGYEGAQDHDLFLRISEVTNNIYHVPKILYHWRMIPTSTSMSSENKNYASDKGLLAVQDALKRRNLSGKVEKDAQSGYYIVHYELKTEPLVSIIIPTRDYATTTEKCLLSIYKTTSYKNFEVILVNNNSVEEETFKLFEKYKRKYKNFRVIDANFEFNYSKINNYAVQFAKGDYLCLLNNDTEIIDSNWLTDMVGYASLDHIGCVGPKLLYPDTTVQHAGVILGLGGVASHAYIGMPKDANGMFGRLRVPYNYSAVTAACLVIKKSKFLEVDGFDEELKVAYNDIDLNIRILHKGYKNICIPFVKLYHFESKSRGLDTTGEKYQRFLKESNYMYSHWDSDIKKDIYYNPNFSQRYWFVLDKNGFNGGCDEES